MAWRSALVGSCVGLLACGSTVIVQDDDGAGGTGASTSSTTSTTITTSTSGTTSTSSTSSTTGSGGAGGCEAPSTLCGDECVDLSSDVGHCGDCFDFCPEAHHCAGGACVPIGCSGGAIEAEDPLLVAKTDGWATSFGDVLHDGAGLESYSDYSNDSLSFSFVGTGLVVYYARGPNRGSMFVSVDGAPPVYVDATLAGFQYQVPAIIAIGLPAGEHGVTLECDPGTGYCSPDYFGVVCDP